MDIVGGLVGCLFTLIIMIFVGPMIYIASPGPIFFAQERVGRNGRKFKMYKFRSMYMDAEERKKELMAQNKIDDGMMFKMDFDPRIIGNNVLPNGKKKTGIGQFIRKTSLDEFPQFFNILVGDMSLVGTRPPTLDEWEKYEPHHRARMSFRPGLTGLWQVSGRSNITDLNGHTLYAPGNLVLTGNGVNVKGGSIVVDGNLNLSCDVNLGGGKLQVKGNLIQSDDTLTVAGGTVDVSGDYRMENENVDSTGNVSYSYSSAKLIMTNSSDIVNVGGTFENYVDSWTYDSDLQAGVMNVKGDFVCRDECFSKDTDSSHYY